MFIQYKISSSFSESRCISILYLRFRLCVTDHLHFVQIEFEIESSGLTWKFWNVLCCVIERNERERDKAGERERERE